jgi:DnaJ-class molecular chaperone
MESIFDQITEARTILELSETATMKQIRENYRRLVKEWHPDKGAIHADVGKLQEKVDRTNAILKAYKTISAYCGDYRYSFKQEEVEKYMSDLERWHRQYGTDPIWTHDGKK